MRRLRHGSGAPAVNGSPATVRVRPFTVVPQNGEFLVGTPETGTFFVMPEVGVRVLELLRSGKTLDEVTVQAAELAGTAVDVEDFVASLTDLGLVSSEAEDVGPPAPEPPPVLRRPPLWHPLMGLPAWLLAGGSVVFCLSSFATRPGLWPTYRDFFFLSTPARSLAALTAITLLIAGAHEVSHWLGARLQGLPARITVTRRFYLLTFETDLTGLWALPRERRIWPLLMGMASDVTLLAIVLAARMADSAGMWHAPPAVAKLLAAVTLTLVYLISGQFYVFARTDLYALLVVATGCYDLARTTSLTLRSRLRMTSAAQRAELEAAHPRDRAVARWYVWCHIGGMTLAATFFVLYFAPTTIRSALWVAGTLSDKNPMALAFWEAAGLGVLILLPRTLGLAVAVRDGWRRIRAHRAGRSA
ncbi:PqqD family protein [Microbispora sp. ATCC PTA-5024]|uniref:PqqD family protein n=1 Tax=Microbispora sp. ATCC PTA-5024 TaxID=316330 RepID=UPI0003DBE4DA|nr:PqqD family protein [Microbispora sp. ATCC PTA-5024]ETK32815.1 hypothetical protein MPTA5024_27780 [Microbispora sp. ATCC PTA-5024]